MTIYACMLCGGPTKEYDNVLRCFQCEYNMRKPKNETKPPPPPKPPSPNAQGGFTEPDVVDHPSHYQTESGLESIDVIEAFGFGFNLGNLFKYIARGGSKPGQSRLRDLEKAKWYLEREIMLEKKKA